MRNSGFYYWLSGIRSRIALWKCRHFGHELSMWKSRGRMACPRCGLWWGLDGTAITTEELNHMDHPARKEPPQ